MQIQRLQVTNVRNLSRVSVSLKPINIFYGINGSGKTSLLEAVHLLLMGRSFRQAQLRPLISDDTDQTTVFADLLAPDGTCSALGLSRQRGSAKPMIKLDGTVLSSLSELVKVAPVLVLAAESFEILIGGPANRRSFLDWGLFHVEPEFYPAWRLAQRALKQRNSLIRHGKIDREQLLLWTREYARYGEQVDSMRRSLIEDLVPLVNGVIRTLLPSLEQHLDIAYLSGWQKDMSLAEALEHGLEGDIQQGHTRSGPHRADLRAQAGSHLAADVLSRGQIKMLVAALHLAQAELLIKRAGKRSIFLVDDLAAELDKINRKRLCGELERLQSQVFVTSIGSADLAACWEQTEQVQVFHVEHGNISPVHTAQ